MGKLKEKESRRKQGNRYYRELKKLRTNVEIFICLFLLQVIVDVLKLQFMTMMKI